MKSSIIICTFNVGNRLRRTLDSVLAQELDDYEVIIIDGASTDGVLVIIKEYWEKFGGKMRWISEKDNGIYEAMNKGVRMARGEFLNIIGAGDWYEDGAFEKVFDAIKNNSDVDAVYGKTHIWDKNRENSRVVQTMPAILPTQPMQHPAIFYKKELHDKFGMYDENYEIVADYLFCLKVFYFGKATVKAIDAVTNNFVMDGMSSVKTRECEKENKKVRKELGIRRKIRLPNPLRIIKKRLKFLK